MVLTGGVGAGQEGGVSVVVDEAVQRRLLRWSAGELVRVLDAHRGLPVLAWTVTPRA